MGFVHTTNGASSTQTRPKLGGEIFVLTAGSASYTGYPVSVECVRERILEARAYSRRFQEAISRAIVSINVKQKRSTRRGAFRLSY
jgi:hypothetical protein